MPRPLSLPTARATSRIVLALVAMVVLASAILSQPARRLSDFDQLFYVTLAYDLDRYGVFSNSIFDDTDSTQQAPPAGMFFGPVYPTLVLAAMKIDRRFAAAVRCSVEAINEHRDEATCEPYATPVRLIHALLLALGVLAIAVAGELMFGSRAIFWLTGTLATVSLAAEADIFSFIMTEAVTFAIYSLCLLGVVLAWTTGRRRQFILAGGLLGLLCLTRPSFLVLMPVVAGLSLLHGYRLCDPPRPLIARRVLALVLAFMAVLGVWGARNAISVGKLGLTEEYGSAVLIERFAYNDMTAHEFILAFPYCVPGLGDLAFDKIYGTDSMHRFVFHTRDSFFHVGRDRRDALVAEHGRLDPLIGGIVREEMRASWWRHLLVAVPLAWCGMWAGGIVSLFLLPLFGWACWRAWRQSQPLLLLYVAPAIAMLGLHAAVANHYTRYNLILIGPFALATAWLISGWLANMRRPRMGVMGEAGE
jgi:4-amino-4-deoxy-L-arabinose transferase-like glycosyltransferase